MKRAPRSRQRHDLYAKYHDYDSEISDLLGECGIDIKDDAQKPQEATSDDSVKVGTIHERCLFSWDDSFNVHSVGGWPPKVRMKKLRHCTKLTAVGPVDVAGVAKEFVSECINSALNDEKAAHILKGLIAIAVDIGSAGVTGGSATFAAATDYALAVKDRALRCLTDEKKVENIVAGRAGGKISASVQGTSEWIYWNL